MFPRSRHPKIDTKNCLERPVTAITIKMSSHHFATPSSTRSNATKPIKLTPTNVRSVGCLLFVLVLLVAIEFVSSTTTNEDILSPKWTPVEPVGEARRWSAQYVPPRWKSEDRNSGSSRSSSSSSNPTLSSSRATYSGRTPVSGPGTLRQQQQNNGQHHHHPHHHHPHHHHKLLRDAPAFAEPMANHTVPLGRDVTFECVVNNLGSYKLAWIRLDSSSQPTIISIGTQIVFNISSNSQYPESQAHRSYGGGMFGSTTKAPSTSTQNSGPPAESRYRVSHSNHRQWQLIIKNIRIADRGLYACQINSEPPVSLAASLDVLVAPSIDYNATSSDVSVDERHRMAIRCRANGHPPPSIVWRREDGRDINLGLFGGKRYSANKVEGEYLNISQVTRDDMGAYLCIASNSVPPSVSKRIIVRVNFRPKIKVSNQLVGSSVGSNVQFECRAEASPPPLTSWIRYDGEALMSSDKYLIEEENDAYRTKMKLKIHNLDEKDFGTYKCVVRNSIGTKEGLVRLYEIPPAATPESSSQQKEWPTYVYSYEREALNGTLAQDLLASSSQSLINTHLIAHCLNIVALTFIYLVAV